MPPVDRCSSVSVVYLTVYWPDSFCQASWIISNLLKSPEISKIPENAYLFLVTTVFVEVTDFQNISQPACVYIRYKTLYIYIRTPTFSPLV